MDTDCTRDGSPGCTPAGRTEPPLVLTDRRGRSCSPGEFEGRPVLVALGVPDFDTAQADAVRPELRGLGSTLLLLGRGGSWLLTPDDPLEPLGPRSPEALAEFLDHYETPGQLSLLLFERNEEQSRLRWRHHDQSGALTLCDVLRRAAREHREPSCRHVSRRELMLSSLITALSIALLDRAARGSGAHAAAPPAAGEPPKMKVSIEVNGARRTLEIEPRVTLLDALREELGLYGTKKGCDHGQCGACTVLVNGRRINACLTLAVMHEGAKVTTIEGLGTPEKLHPMQQAFLQRDALQCGYCTPGQIISAVALVAEGRGRTPEQIREQMSGNICRCGAYPNIVAAILDAQKG